MCPLTPGSSSLLILALIRHPELKQKLFVATRFPPAEGIFIQSQQRWEVLTKHQRQQIQRQSWLLVSCKCQEEHIEMYAPLFSHSMTAPQKLARRISVVTHFCG